MIDCPDCGRHFVDDAAWELHYVYDVATGVANGAFGSRAEIAAAFPERRRCAGSDEELRATCGLKYRGWLSMSGVRDDYWSTGT
jgi:hypothetical protein